MGDPVIHFDISGQVPDELYKFYSLLFGWTIDPIAELHYALIRTPAGTIDGGIGPARDGVGRVTIYVEVGDLQATLDKAGSLGGGTIQEPVEVPGVVTLAMLADPAGNYIGVCSAGEGTPPVPVEGTGAPVTWFEIMGPDAPVLVAFYTGLFGWTAAEMDLGTTDMRYWMVATGNERGIQGGIGSPPGPMSYTTVYAEPGDLQACLDRAAGLGGKTLLTPMALKGGPTLAMLADPQGNHFGIYERRR